MTNYAHTDLNSFICTKCYQKLQISLEYNCGFDKHHHYTENEALYCSKIDWLEGQVKALETLKAELEALVKEKEECIDGLSKKENQQETQILRDKFALAVMPIIYKYHCEHDPAADSIRYAKSAYGWADLMLEAREQK